MPRPSRSASSQRARPLPRPSSPWPPRPANDNFPLPRPANDNFPRPPRPVPRPPIRPGSGLTRGLRFVLGRALWPAAAGLILWDLYNQWQTNPHKVNLPAGWRLLWQCPPPSGAGGGPKYLWNSDPTMNATIVCGINGVSAVLDPSSQPPADANQLLVAWSHPLPPFQPNNYRWYQEYWAPPGTPIPPLWDWRFAPYMPPQLPELNPPHLPALDPLIVPPFAPTPYPSAPNIRPGSRPRPGQNPWRSPSEQPSRGNDPAPAPNPTPNPNPGPGPEIEIPDITKPVVRVSPQPRDYPNPGPGQRLNPRFQPRRPSRANEKERKKKPGKAWSLFNEWALSPATEARDLLKSFHDALPPRYQAKPTPADCRSFGAYAMRGAYRIDEKSGRIHNFNKPGEKCWTVKDADMAKALWKHFQHLDIDEALWNIIENSLEDFAIGKFSQAASKASLDMKLPRGVEWGPAL